MTDTTTYGSQPAVTAASGSEVDGVQTNTAFYSERQPPPNGCYFTVTTDPLGNAAATFCTADGSPRQSSGAVCPSAVVRDADSRQIEWGSGLSGSLPGTDGVGGLLAVIRDDGVCFPCYDRNRNITEYITEYIDASVAVRAHYGYSPFGEAIERCGVYEGWSLKKKRAACLSLHTDRVKGWAIALLYEPGVDDFPDGPITGTGKRGENRAEEPV
jgi:hypothetical protein